MGLIGLKARLKYPAIWQTRSVIDSAELLQEFQRAMAGELRRVYPQNDNWTGVTVLSRGKIDHVAALPRLCELLDKFGRDNVIGVTYFNLAPRSSLHRHRDMNGNLLFGVMRLHIPLLTNPRAIMEVQKKPYQMPINTLWALDTSGLHALENGGDQNRIHLVIDVRYGDATAEYFPRFSLALVLHLACFVVIITGKVIRDLVTKPVSLLHRLRALSSRITGK